MVVSSERSDSGNVCFSPFRTSELDTSAQSLTLSFNSDFDDCCGPFSVTVDNTASVLLISDILRAVFLPAASVPNSIDDGIKANSSRIKHVSSLRL